MRSFQPPSKVTESRANAVQRVSQPTKSFVNNHPQAVRQRMLLEVANSSLTSKQPIQMVNEGTFRANPEEFLKTNVLSLNPQAGMNDRAGSNKVALKVAHDNCARNMGSLAKHWFKLVPDESRSKRGRAAYNLTPAIEKYLHEDQASILGPLLGGVLSAEQTALKNIIERAFPLEAETNYITSAYVDFITGNKAQTAAEIGHTTITQSREHEVAFNPDFVFTATMNGCAFAVTSSETEGHFTAWHFPSTGSNLDSASNFRQTRNPKDWYGVDEYDDNNHDGLFEVTNFLHRGSDNQWNVISQQNDAATEDKSVTIKKVHKRRLNIGDPDKFGTTKRIYLALHKSDTNVMLRDLSIVVETINIFSPKMRPKLKAFDLILKNLLTQETQLLAAATDLVKLNEAGRLILLGRTTNQAKIANDITELTDHLNATYDVESVKEKKIIGGRNNLLVSRLVNGESKLRAVLTGYNRVQAINALITESTEPPVIVAPVPPLVVLH